MIYALIRPSTTLFLFLFCILLGHGQQTQDNLGSQPHYPQLPENIQRNDFKFPELSERVLEVLKRRPGSLEAPLVNDTDKEAVDVSPDQAVDIIARNYVIGLSEEQILSIIQVYNYLDQLIGYDIDIVIDGQQFNDYRDVANNWKDYIDSQTRVKTPRNEHVERQRMSTTFRSFFISSTFDYSPVRATHGGVSNFFAGGWIALEIAKEELDTGFPTLGRVYAMSHWARLYLFEYQGKRILVEGQEPYRVFDPISFFEEAQKNVDERREYIQQIFDNEGIDFDEEIKSSRIRSKELFKNIIKDNGENNTESVLEKNEKSSGYIPNLNAFEPKLWHYGCAPTAAAMVMNYWNNSDFYGRLNYWWFRNYENIAYNEWHCHVATAQRSLAISMNTNSNGGTVPGDIHDGMKNYANAQGYSFSDGYNWNGTSINFRWSRITDAIDNGVPFVWTSDWIASSRHSVAAIGYRESDKHVIFYNTWSNGNQTSTASFSGGIIDMSFGASPLKGGADSYVVDFVAPDGYQGFSGSNQCLPLGTFYTCGDMTIEWNSYGGSAHHVSIFYSTNGGNDWNHIVNAPDNGSYIWRDIPQSAVTNMGRILIQPRNSSNTTISSDGSYGNFRIVAGSGPSLPGTISGPSPVCQGTTNTYSISSVSGATSYQWEYTGGGTPSGSGTSVSLTPTSSGTLRVRAVNSCGSSSWRERSITVNQTPSIPGTISGSSPICASECTPYSFSAVSGATSYTWEYSGGGTPSGSGTSVTLCPTSSGTLRVRANNSCGSSSWRERSITVNQPPSTPGSIIGNSPVCQGTTSTYSISPVSGATSYEWQLPSGWSGSSTSASISATAGANGGTIRVRAKNLCGNSSWRERSITVTPLPSQPGAIAGPQNVAANSTHTYSISPVTGATSYTWTLPSGWSGSSTSTSISATAGTSGGTISVRANNSCGSSTAQTLSVTVNDETPPPDIIVSPTSLSFGAVSCNQCDTKNYTLTGRNLTANITVTAPSGFGVSTQPTSGFAGTITVPRSGSNVDATIYVRFCPTENKTYSGQVSNSSTGATTKNVSVSGSSSDCGTTPPPCSTPPPVWTPVSNLQYNMQVTAKLKIDGAFSTNISDKVGAFVNGQCRGVGTVQSNGFVFLTIGSNVQSGETVSFVIWDSQTCETCQISQTIPFQNLQQLGTPSDPYIIECSPFVDLDLAFGQGFTWFSVNVDPGNMSPGQLFSGVNPCDNNRIIGQTQFSTYSQGGWMGSLTTINPSSGYVFELCAQRTKTITGTPVPISPITLGSGFTWIGYLPQGCQSINTALSGISPSPVENNRIISQSAFSVYSSGQWIGSLSQLCPGQAYVMQMSNQSTLTYSQGSAKEGSMEKGPDGLGSPAGIYPLQNSQYVMTLIGRLASSNEELSLSQGDVIYAFVGDECRGIGYPEEAHDGLVFMTISSNVEYGEPVEFKVWLESAQELVGIEEVFSFESLKGLGTISSPVLLNMHSVTGLGDKLAGGYIGDPFPNPFAHITNFPISLVKPGQVSLEIYNSMGQVIYRAMEEMDASGAHQVTFENKGLPYGVYFYRLRIDAQDQVMSRAGRLMISR